MKKLLSEKFKNRNILLHEPENSIYFLKRKILKHIRKSNIETRILILI